MAKLGFKIVTRLAFLLILLVGMSPPVFAADGDETTVGSLTLVPTFECISVYSNFSGDNNENNSASFQWREAGGSWKPGMALTVDRRATVTSEDGTYPNDFQNQWRASILGLTPNTEYEVRVTYVDPDGFSGVNTVEGSITTRDDNFVLGSGSTYYVAKTGDDENPGTESQPWLTIQHASDSISSGDTVYIKEGTYAETVTIATSGASGNWITFLNYSNDTVTIDGEDARSNMSISNGVHYVRVKGLRFLNASGRALTINDNAHDIVIEDNYFTGMENSAIRVGTNWDSGTNIGNIVIQSNDIRVTTLGNGAPHFISFQNATGGGHVIRNNTLTDTTNNFPSSTGHIDGIGGYQGAIPEGFVHRDSDIYDNYLEGIPDDAIEADGGDINVRIWNNTIKNCLTGISHNACITGPCYVFRNVAWITLPNRICLLKLGHYGIGPSYHYHNTFYTTRPNDGFKQTNDGLGNIISRNNIIHVGRNVIEFKSGSGEGVGHDFDYDNLYSTDPARFVSWGAEKYDNLTEFQTGTSPQQELHGMSIDATNEFVDASNSNFQLKSDSQFVDKGEILVGFNDSNSPWPYQGSAPDIGAYEYNSGPIVDNTPPYTTGHNPAKGASGIARTTNITVHVRDSGVGVDQSSIVMTVEGTAVTPTITGTPADYTLTYNPPSDFDYEQVVDVTVDAQDLDSTPNVMTQDAYSFSIAAVDNTPPYTTGHNPANGAVGRPRNTNIVVHVKDDGDGVDQSSIVMMVEGAAVTPTITGTPADYTLTYNPPSNFNYEQVVDVTVDAQDLASPPNTMIQDAYSFTITADESQWPYLPVRVNCAGADYTDGSSNLWEDDRAYTSGNWGFYGPDNTVDRGTGHAISGTADDRIYQTERYGLDGYRFDLGNGTYDISLHFAETYSGITGAGQRVFDVFIEGQLVLNNLDIYDEVGGNAALIKTISNISVADGQLTIVFTPVTENPLINGIMIADAAGNQPPVALNDSYSVAVDGTLNIPSPGVLSNDSDGDSDPLTAILVSDVSHGSLTLSSNGSFTYSPDTGYTGTDSFTYRANDGQENSNTATVTITVSGGNQPPVLNTIGNKSVDEGELLEFAVSASDPDNDPLTYSISNRPSGASFNPGTRTFSWTPSSIQVGTYSNVHFQVSDGELTDSEEITITVNRPSSQNGGGGGGSASPSNKAPVLNTVGNKLVYGGQLLEFTVSATDPDDDPLTYSTTNLPPGASFDPETRTFSWTPSTEQAGSYPGVYFEVSDGKLVDSEEITITVNNPPVLDTIGDKKATEEELFELTISATDPDEDPLTYSACNLPSGASFDADTQTFSWTPDPGQEGTYSNVHFEVTDGSLIGFEEITITVYQADKIPPEIGEVVASEINPDNVEICWTTDEPSTSQVKYWASPSKVTPLDETLVTHHVVRLTNLVPGTTYYYMTLSRDEKGNIAVSPTYTFTTPVRPVTFTISELNITPAKANIGEEITINVLVTNTSDVTRDYEVILYVDDEVEDSKQIVDLGSGASQWITFNIVKNTAVPFMVGVNGANGSLVVEEEARATEEINFIKVNPRFSIETGKLDSARVRYQVAKFNASMADVELVLVVNLDGKPFETVSLPLSSQLEPDGIIGIFDYTPSQRWRSGTYTFQVMLYEGDWPLESTNIDNLEVTPEFVVREVKWVTLGQIIGGALVVIAITLLYVLYRRRRILKGYIEDA